MIINYSTSYCIDGPFMFERLRVSSTCLKTLIFTVDGFTGYYSRCGPGFDFNWIEV